MRKEDRIKESLSLELATLRRRVAELERSESEHREVEEVLRHSEEQLRLITDALPVLIAYVDSKHHYRFNNKAYEELYGYSRAKMTGKHIKEVMGESAYQKMRGYAEAALSGKEVTYESVLPIKGVGKRYFGATYIPHFGEKGNVKGFIALISDITERKKIEEELRRSEASLAEAQRVAQIGSWELNLVSNTLTWSDEVYRMFGLKPQQFGATYEAFLDNIYPDDREMVDNVYTESVENKTPYDIVHRLLLKDGTIKYVNERCETYYDDEGKPIRSIGTVQDITERKHLEELERQKVRLEAEISERKRSETEIKGLAKFPDENPNPVLRVARDGTILYANPASSLLLDVWQCQAGQLIPEQWRDFVLDALSSRLSREAEVECRDRILSLTFAPIAGSDYVNIYGLDVTERRQAEEKERQLQKELNLSSRLASIGELAAGVAHEINNPLTGVLGFSERLLRKSSDENIRRDLQRVYDEAQRAAKVVQNLLTFARRREPKKEYIDINGVVLKTLELRDYELKASNIEVTTKLDGRLQRVMADFYQIEQVFLSIIINAEQAITEAKIGGRLSIKTRQLNSAIRISITDDGPGIAAENLDKVFDPFFTTRADRSGTGLGLSLCHGIVMEHGGRIYAKSKPGKGAAFFVELPVAPEKIAGVAGTNSK